MTRTQIKFEVIGSMNLEDLQSLLKSISRRYQLIHLYLADFNQRTNDCEITLVIPSQDNNVKNFSDLQDLLRQCLKGTSELDQIEDDFEYNVYFLCVKFYENELKEEIKEWFNSMDNKPIETLVDMHKFGYEVEKEKVYRARHKLTGEYLSQNYAKTGYYHSLDHFHILKLSKKDWEDLVVWGDSTYEIEEVEE